MFRDVPSPSQGVDFAEFIEPGRYILKLLGHEDLGPSQFAKPEDQNPAHRIKWRFAVARGDSPTIPLRTQTGEVFELFGYTSSATGEKSAARPWIEALLGRSISPGEKGAELAQAVIGQKAWAMLDIEVTPGEQGQEARSRLKILSLSPYREGEQPGRVKQAAKPMPVAAAIPVAVEEPAF